MKSRKVSVKNPNSRGRCQFRIIGGQWRGRKLSFPDSPGLRPTPDRVRETVFNWLADKLAGAECLDLFCGSGAMGLEALSRGAKQVHFMDSSPAVVASIRHHLGLLPGASGKVISASLPEGLQVLQESFDLVFLDPPYADAKKMIAASVEGLLAEKKLRPEAWLYVENSSVDHPPALPCRFTLHRQKVAGQVRYSLFHYQADPL